MGRELRKVIPNWEHPKKRHAWGVDYIPMHGESFAAALAEWVEKRDKWLEGKCEYQDAGDPRTEQAFIEYHGDRPESEDYRPDWKLEEMTWWQVYETVSEGTPVTPPFATREELVEYIVANGDFWDQKRRSKRRGGMPCAPWTRQQAMAFVFGTGWAPSLVSSAAHGLETGVEFIGRTEVVP